MNRFLSSTLIVLLLSVAAAPPGYAQAYPDRPIRVIGSSSPGGISDVFIRAVGDELHKRLGQPLIVENRAGGPSTFPLAPARRRPMTATPSASCRTNR